jgi:NAD(P)-dependent dehydrogenase (short-subunit alcohol dehydrogenase family)
MTLGSDAARLDGCVAVVTGGGAGIGRGIAEGLHAFGASVAIWERDSATATSAAAAVEGLAVTVDVREDQAVDEAVSATLGRFGRIDILVNNAGGTFSKPFLETSPGAFDALYRANLRHVLVCTRQVARWMVDAGVAGSIINVSSIEGVRAAPGYAAYAAAKAGVLNFTKTAALELAPFGIRVNALAPDFTMTEGIAAMMPEASQSAAEGMVPLARVGHVDEMAGAALFLSSRLSSYVTGQTLHVDGGTHAAGGWYHHPEDGDYILGPPAPAS